MTKTSPRKGHDNNIQELRPAKGLIPPHDLDAEGSVLSACVLDEHALDLCLGLGITPEMFYSRANRNIFAAIIGLRQDNLPVDVTLVAARLRDQGRLQEIGGSPYLAQIVDATPAAGNVESHALLIRDKWRLRMAIATMRARATEAYGDVESVQVFLDGLEADLAEIGRSYDARKGLSLIGHAARLALERIVTANEEGRKAMVGVPFGYERIDALTKGMMAGDLIVIAGRPGMGKTSFALGVAIHVSGEPERESEHEQLTSAVFSLEMTEEQLALRAIAIKQKLYAQRLRAYEIAKQEWPIFIDGVAWTQKLSLWVDDTPQLTVADIRSRARRLKAECEREGRPRLGLIVVDYLQIMAGRPGEDHREQIVAESARGLKALGKELGCPVLALAQLNRAVETRSTKDKRPQLSDLRESGAIEQEADLVAFLYRDEYYNPESPDKGLAEFIVGKQRSGPTRMVRLKFTPEYTRFDNLADETYEFDEFDGYEDG